MDRFHSQSDALDSKRHSKPASRQSKRISRGWFLLLIVVLLSCSLLMGLRLPQMFTQPAEAGAAKLAVVVDIRYENLQASEVFLIWGINGWQPVSADLRPAGTTLDEKGLMKTPLQLENGTFTGQLLVPTWSLLEYGFTITAAQDGQAVDIWDGSDAYQLNLTESDRVIEVRSAVGPDQAGAGPGAGPIGGPQAPPGARPDGGQEAEAGE
jgi:hypothetical protein